MTLQSPARALLSPAGLPVVAILMVIAGLAACGVVPLDVPGGMLIRWGAALTPAALTTFIWWRHSRAAARQTEANRSLASRSSTVDRLLDFSQTIQGAGKSDQIFAALKHYLPIEFNLSGLVVLSVEPECLPPVSVKASWPDEALRQDQPLGEMDTALCPCLRQNLPRCFKADSAPVRCAIDRSLNLPTSHSAFCIPFNIGRTSQVLVHMLLPPGEEWTEERKQIAQTYVNTANSSLITLHHLEVADKQSMTDALTGMFNRRSMDQLLSREVALADRHGLPFSLVIIDMDHFKEVNDTHGHAAGDHLLRAFADCVRMTLRKTDLAFRYGGDEFVIGLPQCSIAQAQQVVQKIRQALSAADFSDAIANLEQQPTLSIGLAERSTAMNLRDLPSLLNAADAALYEAKASNRNCVKIYQPPKAA